VSRTVDLLRLDAPGDTPQIPRPLERRESEESKAVHTTNIGEQESATSSGRISIVSTHGEVTICFGTVA